MHSASPGLRDLERARSEAWHASRHARSAELALLRGDVPTAITDVLLLAGALDDLLDDLGIEELEP